MASSRARPSNGVRAAVAAFANGASILEIRGTDVQVNNNAFGIVVLPGGNLTIRAFLSSTGSTLTVDGNGIGITLLGGRLPVFTSSTIKVTNNGIGILANDAAFIINASPVGSGEFVLENNQVGMNFESGAGASFQSGPLTIRNNGVGLLADGAGTLTIWPLPESRRGTVTASPCQTPGMG